MCCHFVTTKNSWMQWLPKVLSSQWGYQATSRDAAQKYWVHGSPAVWQEIFNKTIFFLGLCTDYMRYKMLILYHWTVFSFLQSNLNKFFWLVLSKITRSYILISYWHMYFHSQSRQTESFLIWWTSSWLDLRLRPVWRWLQGEMEASTLSYLSSDPWIILAFMLKHTGLWKCHQIRKLLKATHGSQIKVS